MKRLQLHDEYDAQRAQLLALDPQAEDEEPTPDAYGADPFDVIAALEEQLGHPLNSH